MRASRAYAHLATPVPADWSMPGRQWRGHAVAPVTDPWGVPPVPEPSATAQLVQLVAAQRARVGFRKP